MNNIMTQLVSQVTILILIPLFPLLLSSISYDTLAKALWTFRYIPSSLVILHFRNFTKKEISLPESSQYLKGNHSCSKGIASDSGGPRSNPCSVHTRGQPRPWAALAPPPCHSPLTRLTAPVQRACLLQSQCELAKTNSQALVALFLVVSPALFGARTVVVYAEGDKHGYLRHWSCSLNCSYLWTLSFFSVSGKGPRPTHLYVCPQSLKQAWHWVNSVNVCMRDGLRDTFEDTSTLISTFSWYPDYHLYFRQSCEIGNIFLCCSPTSALESSHFLHRHICTSLSHPVAGSHHSTSLHTAFCLN